MLILIVLIGKNYKLNLMKIFLLFVLFIGVSMAQKHNVTQVTSRTFHQELRHSQFSLLYIYSSSCTYCQQFTPLFQKLSTQPFFIQKQVRFLKVDEQLFKNETQKFGVYSYPTILFFWKDFSNHPIAFKEDRSETNLKAFVEIVTKINENKIPDAAEMSPYQRTQEKVVLYYGDKSKPLYKALGLASNRDRFFSWTTLPTDDNEKEILVIGNKRLPAQNLTIDQIQTAIKKVFARVFTLGQEPWVRIFLNKQLGIIHINPSKNGKYAQLLNDLSKQFYNIVFLELTPDHPQYKAALKTFAIPDEQNIIAVDRRSQAAFVANSPHVKESLVDFIQKVQKYQWPVYKKTQKTTKQEKLTRDNFKQKMSTNQDIVLFLYKRHQKISKNLMDLFNHLRYKLSENKNVLFLRCDVASNQVEQLLEFTVEKTPKIVYYRNRQKDKPIHFYGGKISEESVVEFIMENTTFDWKDEWGEL